MEFALVTYCRSCEPITVRWPFIPCFLVKYVLPVLPPWTARLPGGFVYPRDGTVVFAPILATMLDSSPRRCKAAIDRTAAYLSALRVSSIGVDPALDALAQHEWYRGSSVSAALVLDAVERLLDASGLAQKSRPEVAVLGQDYPEILAMAASLAPKAEGINVTAASPMALERLATRLWRLTGVGVRIHRDPAGAVKRSGIVLVAGAGEFGGLESALRPGAILVDLRYPHKFGRSVKKGSEISVVEAPAIAFNEDDGALALEPPAFCALLEAAFGGIVGGINRRPSMRDLRKIQLLMEQANVKTRGFWHSERVDSLPALTQAFG